ncbi:hypothetical protein CYY_001229 [Polysphondylium violaceum]|uniref:Uncharacterized protein n=1 Tax=Polysphondylium violaceum TaxID=133409 RepID=A0A8J4Q9M5_9MYCE|nr:hypothetical protein CYY_001229 [Polysphondylium violaceum]
MGEFINNIQEKIEITVGDAINSRQKALENFVGLGPPDLCVLTKLYEPPRFVPGLKTHKISSYHWVSGVNTSSTSAIAVYLGSLIENQEKSSFGRGLYRIDQFHLVSYNAFLKQDLHVEFSIGSGNSTPVVYTVGANGEKNTVEEIFWKETYISSVLRHMQGTPSYLRPVKQIACLKDPKDEADFFKICSEYFWQGRRLGAFDDDDLFVDLKTQKPQGLSIDDSNNVLVTTLMKYFGSRNRYLPMLNFFEEFYKTEPVACVPVVRAHRLMGDSHTCQFLLEKSLDKCPNSVSLLLEMSLTYLFKFKSESNSNNNNNNNSTTPGGSTPTLSSSSSSSSLHQDSNNNNNHNNNNLILGLQYCLKALSIEPLMIKGWSIAASILLQMGYIEWALVFLNNTPYTNNEYAVDRLGKAKYSRVTPEQEHPNIMTIIEDDELEFDEEPGEEFLKCLTSQSLSGDSSKYFEMLILMFKKIGWIQLADKKTKILDELAIILRNKERKKGNNKINNNNMNNNNSNNNNDNNDDNNKQHNSNTKDGHNSVSSVVNRNQATENTENTENTNTDDTDSACEPAPVIPESNVPTEVLWRDEDVTSEGSDIEDLEKVDLNEDGSPSTTTPVQQQKILIPRPEFNEKSISYENLSQSLSNFIDHFGLESSKPVSVPTSTSSSTTTKEYINFDIEPNFLKVKLAVSPINRNLELAFHALFQDIKAFQAWKEEEESKKLENGGALVFTMKQMNQTRTVADWIRLARLAYRIGEIADSEKLYRMVFDEKFHILALIGLVKIFADHGDTRNCLMSCSTICKYFSSEKINCLDIHPVVESSVLKLISLHGLQKVRTIYSSISDLAPILSGLFLDSVKWRSYGFDK